MAASKRDDRNIGDGRVALKIIDEIVTTLRRGGLVPHQDLEGIAASFAAEASRTKGDDRRIAQIAQQHALQWLIEPEASARAKINKIKSPEQVA